MEWPRIFFFLFVWYRKRWLMKLKGSYLEIYLFAGSLFIYWYYVMLFLDEIHRNSKYSCLAETIHPDSSSLIQKNWGLKCLSVCGYYWRWLKRICQTVCVCELLAVPPNNSFSSLNAGLFGSWVTQVLLWKLHPIAGISSQSLYLSKIFQLIRGHATYKQDLELWTAWDAQSLIQTSKSRLLTWGKGEEGAARKRLRSYSS